MPIKWQTQQFYSNQPRHARRIHNHYLNLIYHVEIASLVYRLQGAELWEMWI